MNAAPKGKIGRLPKAIQEQVNRRLDNGEKGWPLVAWLNSLPEVSAVMAAEFAGQPIREQNLSRWHMKMSPEIHLASARSRVWATHPADAASR
jgi:hypothetical protein